MEHPSPGVMRGSDPIMGVPVHTTTSAPEWMDGPLYQWRYPRSKAGRVRKKWARRRRNFEPTRVRYAVQMGGVLVMHPRTYYGLTGGPEPRELITARRLGARCNARKQDYRFRVGPRP